MASTDRPRFRRSRARLVAARSCQDKASCLRASSSARRNRPSAVSTAAGALCNSKSSPLRRSNSGVSQPLSLCLIPASSNASPSPICPAWPKASACSVRPVKLPKLTFGSTISLGLIRSGRDPVARSPPLSATTLLKARSKRAQQRQAVLSRLVYQHFCMVCCGG